MKTNAEITAAAKALSTKVVEREVNGVKEQALINREELVKEVNDRQAEVEKSYKAYSDETDAVLRIALLTKAKNAADDLAVAMLALETFDTQATQADAAVEKVKTTIREFGFVTHTAPKSSLLSERVMNTKSNWFSRVF